MNLHIAHQQLIGRIQQYSRQSVEHRQISRRLKDLLPMRFGELKRNYQTRLHAAAKAERAAYTDENFLSHLTEFIEISHTAQRARILYETHLMLFQARQSLRRL